MHLIIEHPDPEAVRLLQEGFKPHPCLEARVTRPFAPGVRPDVDALYLPMPGFEQVPAILLFIHQAHVFRTKQAFPLRTASKDAAEWPPFLLSGFVTRQNEEFSDPRLLPLFIKAAVAAVRRFNLQGQEVIRTVRLDSAWAHMDKLSPQEAAQVIRAAYDEAMAAPEDELEEYGRVRPHVIAMVDFATTEGHRTPHEWQCLFGFQRSRCECALILESLLRRPFASPDLVRGKTEGIPIEFLCPEADRPHPKVGDAFTLWEGGKRIATGVVREVLREA